MWTGKAEKRKILVTSTSPKLKYSNYVICNAIRQVAFIICKKFNLKLLPIDRSPSYRKLTQFPKVIFSFVIYLFQIWAYMK